jgi:hypothetical protein
MSRETGTAPRCLAEYLAVPEAKLTRTSEACWVLPRRARSNDPWRNRPDEANLWGLAFYRNTTVNLEGYVGHRQAFGWERKGGM